MQQQLELMPRRAVKKPTEGQTKKMMGYLEERCGCWVSASQIQTATGLTLRVQRSIRRHVGGKIISGQKGYRLTEYAEPGEVNRFIARMKSQAADMQQAAEEVRVAFELRS